MTRSGSPAALQVRGVTVRVQSRALLDDVSFEVASGEVVAVIGPNGAGKTTLLEVITGMRRSHEGVVYFRGARGRCFTERARHVAFLPDSGALPAELRVQTVVEHALGFRPRSSDLVLELRSALEIDPLLRAPVGILSRGEHQRVALFCTLAVERAVVVLDEPFAAFDPLKLRDVLRVVRRVADSGAAVLATVHHLGDAAQIADRLLILAEGQAIGWGALESLRIAADVPGGTLEDVFLALLSRRSRAA
jgi:ABC-type multidrug transport system ATPase subunit